MLYIDTEGVTAIPNELYNDYPHVSDGAKWIYAILTSQDPNGIGEIKLTVEELKELAFHTHIQFNTFRNYINKLSDAFLLDTRINHKNKVYSIKFKLPV